MKKILLILSVFSMCFSVDVKQVTTTPTTSFTTFNQRVAQIGATNFETFYNNSILPVSGKLQIPATFKGQMIGSSKFTSYNNSSTDTLEFLGSGWKFSDGCFGDSLTVLFAPGAVSEVRPEWWGAKGDSSTNNATALAAMFRAVQGMRNNVKIVFSPGIYKFTPEYSGYGWRGKVMLVDVNNITIEGYGAELRQVAKPAWRADSQNAESPIQFRASGDAGTSLSNIKILGLRIIGDTVTFNPGQDGASTGIVFWGGKNITVRDCYVSGWGTDGIDLGTGYSNTPFGDSAKILNTVCDKNRRQGLSITGFNNVLIDGCNFKNSDNGTNSGTGFQFGIDIEPNIDSITNVKIVNCNFDNNRTGSICMINCRDIEIANNYMKELKEHCTGTIISYGDGNYSNKTGVNGVNIHHNIMHNRVAALYALGDNFRNITFSNNESTTYYLPNTGAQIRINPFGDTGYYDIRIDKNKLYGTGGIIGDATGNIWITENIIKASRQLSSSADCFLLDFSGTGNTYIERNHFIVDTGIAFSSKQCVHKHGVNRDNHYTSNGAAPLYWQANTGGQDAIHGHNWYSVNWIFQDESGNTNLKINKEGTPLILATGEYGGIDRIVNGGYHRTIYGINAIAGDRTYSGFNTSYGASGRVIQGYVCTVAGSPGTWQPINWTTYKGSTPFRPTANGLTDYGVTYIDTTVDSDTLSGGKMVFWNGKRWCEGSRFSKSIKTTDTTTSTSSTTGALVVSGGVGAPHVTTDSLKVGSSGSRFKEIKVIDGAADTLSITVGAKTWKLLPVANQ